MHNSLSLKLGRGAIPGCGFEPDSRPNLPPVGNRPNRRPAGGQPVTASRTCETGSCARIPPRKSRFFPAKRCLGLRRPQERPAKNKRVPGPGNGRKGRCSCDKDSDRHRKSIPKNMAGVYIHIPFCKSRCHYCDFFSGTSLERRRELLAALHAELELRAGTAGPFPAGEPLCPANPRTAPTTTSRTDQAPVSQTTPAKGPGVITLSAANRIETLYFGGGTPSLAHAA